MSSTMFYLILLLTLLSITTFSESWDINWVITIPVGRTCASYNFYECPWDCHMDDCHKPPYDMNCDDFHDQRIPRMCKCDYYDQYDCPPTCHPSDCRGYVQPVIVVDTCDSYNQHNCPHECDPRDCRDYVYFAWYWYVVIVGVIVGIIVLIIVIVCIRMSMSARSPGVNKPQIVESQPQVVATVNV